VAQERAEARGGDGLGGLGLKTTKAEGFPVSASKPGAEPGGALGGAKDAWTARGRCVELRQGVPNTHGRRM
jgi:hypothetical protein